MAATRFLDKGEDGISAMNENVSAMLLKFEAAYTDLSLLALTARRGGRAGPLRSPRRRP
jgi:hypothetical protein